MLITNGTDLGDTSIGLLKELLSLLDSRLKVIENQIGLASNLESNGLFDRAEYFVGVGFVAIQQYLVDTLVFQGFEKTYRAWQYGQQLQCGHYDVALMNAAANYWKHESEEYEKERVQLQSGKKEIKDYDAFVVIPDVTANAEYPLVEVLTILNNSPQLSLIKLLPRITHWVSGLPIKNDLN